MDLDKILETISDGPTKSYAYKRLCYLESKWNMYSLLREYQEIADSKVNYKCIYYVDYKLHFLHVKKIFFFTHFRKFHIETFITLEKLILMCIYLRV